MRSDSPYYNSSNIRNYDDSYNAHTYRSKSPSRKSKKSKRSRSRSSKNRRRHKSRSRSKSAIRRHSRSHKSREKYGSRRYREDSSSRVYAKDTEEIQARLSDDEKDARTINVWQLSNRVRTKDLEKFFGRVGKLCVVKLIMDPRTGKSRGVAYIQFRNIESVEHALELSGERLLGVPIQIRTVSSEKCRAAEASMGLAGINTKIMTKLCISNLHPRISEENVENLFSPFGNLKDVKLVKNTNPTAPNMAYVSFHKGESARNAIEAMNNYDVGGMLIRILPVSDTGNGVEVVEEGMTMNKTDRFDLMAKLTINNNNQPEPTPVPLPDVKVITTPCFVLSNMFDLAEVLKEEELLEEIFEDVLDECNKYGGALHIHIDRYIPNGVVYVKCPSATIAKQCVDNLNGRTFDGRIIKADFIPLLDYTRKFPQSANISRLLTK